MGRWSRLSSYEDTINGRTVAIRDIPERPALEDMRNGVVIIEKPPDGQPFDLIAHKAGAGAAAAWIYAALNEDVAPDPLEIPPGVSLVLPSIARVQRVLQGAPVSEL